MSELAETDREIYQAIQGEVKREREGLELIASENIASKAVMEAQGSVLTNKYAEGYPGARYYGGQEYTDKVENLAIDRAKKIFGAEHVNVQPYSGSPANTAVYFALAEFGDTLMGMDLAQGGHLTHGHDVNFSGQAYNFVSYGVEKETGRIDLDQVWDLAQEHQPEIIVTGATAYPRKIDFKAFCEIAKEVDAKLMADIAHIAGLIAADLHPNPVTEADVVTTTTHKTLRGPRGGMIMCQEELAEAIDEAVFPGLQGGPHEHQIAAKAVCFEEALQPDFKQYAQQIISNAQAMAQTLRQEGFDLVTGGTDNHLLLVDLRSQDVTGKEAEEALGQAGITVNKNMIPYDPRKPWDPSGMRLGTPAITTRGMEESESKYIARLISRAVANVDNDKELAGIREEVKQFSQQFNLHRS